MSSFEQAMTANAISAGKGDPPETDLDYYSKPENYTGSSLQTMQKFKFAKDKQDKENEDKNRKKEKKQQGFSLLARYKHILKGIFDDGDDESSSDEEDEDESKRNDDGLSTMKDCIIMTPKLEGISEDAENEISAKPGESSQEEDVLPPETELQVVDEKQEDVSASQQDNVKTESLTPDGMTPKGLESTSAMDGASSRSGMDLCDSPTGSSYSINSSKRKSTMSHGRGNYMIKTKLEKEVRAKIAKDRFQKACRFVQIVLKISAAAGKEPSVDTGMKTFTDLASEAESTAHSSGLSFDPSYFKAKKEINISTEVKTILSLPSEERTPDQIQTAMFGLQSLRSFAEYPLHMQEKLAKVAWFEVVPAKRIIIRQGHFAENFYFILAGQAVVTLLLRNPKTGASFVKTATIMRRGMSFGELALLHHSRRTATVTSQGGCQLLTIGRQDFFDIFMSGQGNQIPEHIRFVSQCEFMKDWPIDNLLEHPQFCLLHFFKRNVVVVKDSNFSEWVYVVKAGSCQVLRELKGVKARIKYKAAISDKDSKLPTLGTKEAKPKIDTGIRKRKVKSEGEVELYIQDQENKKPKENTPPGSQGSTRQKEIFSKDNYSKFPTTLKAHFSRAAPEPLETKKKYEVPKRCQPPKPPEPIKETNGKPPPVFVQVEALKPRDSFGLETITFPDEAERENTSVSLVSRGAELIMVSKAFFIKHATPTVKRLIRHQVQPYPDENTFQNNLQIKADWELYKNQLIEDLTSEI
ncbi:cyclic nucleotide-binding domain-containing protein 2-like isoform X2 [Mizuhopecten yessoensis]|uniref:Cyclic nucleotide-binding domain-containing protein 2 n=2 Tax=Mizuhopecten yessoensis TaxID=6573 RepID=A0A210R3Q8_MIZYE|nr:cyclic nucleotide-binding domain-containing protein 2-like isoform X2 [Mizuhopecten yessoensis]XP_021364568.1 cyclic nucleotide-binding domain-containing protein 2-like isoform X2 [Mizuhopecten yessoensis]OWF55628.1 Cyclic nucleotide-binding domain-containing protein 2 [Mizuhopecten yessoensis]